MVLDSNDCVLSARGMTEIRRVLVPTSKSGLRPPAALVTIENPGLRDSADTGERTQRTNHILDSEFRHDTKGICDDVHFISFVRVDYGNLSTSCSSQIAEGARLTLRMSGDRQQWASQHVLCPALLPRECPSLSRYIRMQVCSYGQELQVVQRGRV